MTEPGERIPINQPRPRTLAERVTARILAREQQRGNKAREVCMAAQTRRKTKADRAKRKQEVAKDEGSTLEEDQR